MRRRHFETLRPLCPVCLAAERESRLEIATVEEEAGGDVLEGVLRCGHDPCQHEYPVIDGIPVIVTGLREYVAANLAQIQAREDLSATLEGLIGDCCGPGSAHDATRQQLSSYAWDHYGDLDPAEEQTEPRRIRPGSAARLLDRAVELAGELPPGPRLDVGCSVGRTTFELADRGDDLVLGVDLHLAMLRLASSALRRGRVRYPRRRVGLVYDRRDIEADLPGAERVDFWACDAQALPFPAGTFAVASSLNTLDSVASPVAAVESLARVLAPGARAWIATPYDWSPGATRVEAWLGGHSQRGPEAGASEPVLRRLLAGEAGVETGMSVLREEPEATWTVRLHERSSVEYQAHLVVVGKAS